MMTWAHAKLLGAALFLALSLVSWPAQAGTQDSPEIADPAGDQNIQGVPIGMVPLPVVTPGVDLRKGWIEETTDTLVFGIELEDDITGLSPLFAYDYVFNFVSNNAAFVASAHWSGTLPPGDLTVGGVATEVAASGAALRLTVPKSAIDGFRGDVVSGMFVTSAGTLLVDELNSQVDRAPDTGTSPNTYTLTAGFARGGSPTDVDGDGLPDAWEIQHFGSIEAQNGTGDPDGEGLNNTGEFAKGTNPNNPDTDGDFISDLLDPFPLDKTRPVDFDGDGLTDAWEREHFGSIDAQNGTGDPDRDGLNNLAEEAAGTDPNKADTDGDGVEDGVDSAPLDPSIGGNSGESGREAEPELYAGAAMFGIAATFILLGLAKGI